MPFWKRERTISEVEEDNVRLDAELTNVQKRVAIKRLKEAGLTPKAFGFNWRNIIHWLKTH